MRIPKALDWFTLSRWGFIAYPSKGSDKYYECELPKGWKIYDNKHEYLIVDDRDRHRVWGRKIEFAKILYPRYEIQPDFNNDFCICYYVRDRWERRSIFCTEYSSQCIDPRFLDGISPEQALAIDAELRNKAQTWMDLHCSTEGLRCE